MKNPMESKPVFPLLMSMAVPPMVSMLIQSMYNIVDSIFVARLGEKALTAVSLAYPLQNLVLAVAVGLGVGASAGIARNLGAKNQDRVDRIAAHTIFFTAIHAIIFILVGIFLTKPFLQMFTPNENVLRWGCEYSYIVICLSSGSLFHIAIEKMFQSCGNMVIPMAVQALGAIINIILDPIFIFGFNMGVQGAAVATVLSQALSAVWALKFLCGKNTILRIKKKNLKIKASVFLPCAALGIAPFAMQATESVLVLCFNSSLLKYGGDLAVGAMTILSSIMQFAMLPLQGITQGGQPIISYNYGAKKIDRIKQAFKLQTISCVVYATIIWLIAEFAPSIFVSIFTSDPQLAELSQWALRIYLACIFLMGVQVSCQQTFIAFGNSKISAFLAVFRKILVLIPLIYILPAFMEDNVKAVFLAEPIADAIAILTTATLFYINFKKIIKSESQV